MNFTFDTFIERGEDDLAVTVTYIVSPFYRATRMQPAEGGEIEISYIRSTGRNPRQIFVTATEHDALVIQCQQRAQSDIDDAKAAAAEYRAETRRDLA